MRLVFSGFIFAKEVIADRQEIVTLTAMQSFMQQS